MTWDHSISLAIIFATLLGPILAVQTQTYLERRRARKARRLNVFHTLMRTRVTPLAPDAVNALNAVPMEFYGEAQIMTAYQTFIAHINAAPPNARDEEWRKWGDRRIDLLMDLTHKVATNVGYDFSVAQLKRDFYAPQAYKTLEDEQAAIRTGVIKILKGETGLKIEPFTAADTRPPT